MSSSGVIDTSKNYRGMFDSTFILVEDKARFMGDSHEFVEILACSLFILSMNNYIICDPNHSISGDEDLVPHLLEDVLCTG